ncbi:sulfite exporter TauE/SafE family protein (plasmid) [Tistrella bauzanensis]|uniref:Probable membrane transporter protein n=1 Tax=Tistrella arctica TaxID=3133430 RepID=A0ABU9YP67_9PROT
MLADWLDPALLAPGLTAQDLFWAGLAVFGAAVLRGFTGFGFALAAVPLTSLVLPPEVVVPVVMVVQLIIGTGDAVRERRAVDRGVILWLTVGVALATPLGMWLLVWLPPATTRIAIGGVVLLGVAASWRPPDLGDLVRLRSVRIGVGALAGLFTGLAAMPGPPAVAYMLAAERDPRVIRATLMVFFFFTAVAGTISAWGAGLIGRTELVLTAISLPLVIGGSAIGAALFGLGATRFYRPAALIILLATGLTTIIREIVIY